MESLARRSQFGIHGNSEGTSVAKDNPAGAATLQSHHLIRVGVDSENSGKSFTQRRASDAPISSVRPLTDRIFR
jgi:hypothetical protein